MCLDGSRSSLLAIVPRFGSPKSGRGVSPAGIRARRTSFQLVAGLLGVRKPRLLQKPKRGLRRDIVDWSGPAGAEHPEPRASRQAQPWVKKHKTEIRHPVGCNRPGPRLRLSWPVSRWERVLSHRPAGLQVAEGRCCTPSACRLLVPIGAPGVAPSAYPGLVACVALSGQFGTATLNRLHEFQLPAPSS